mmetsp:Transcript_12210/g.22551  ORF Transcript_12210/g.22551 Transcript_12210/m.22551 type:complete len:217 (+) Transcript_12210:33-683(+)
MCARPSLLHRISDVFKRRPIAAGTASSAVLCGISDLCAQGFEARQRQLLIEQGQAAKATSALAQVRPEKRLAFMVAWGAGLGAVLPPWYAMIHTAIKPVMLRILVHQTLWSPTCNFVFLCSCEAVIDASEGLMYRMQRKIEADWFYVVRFAFTFWGCYNIFAFYFLPSHLQTPVMAAVNCGWTTFLSWLGFSRVQSADRHEEAIETLNVSSLLARS